MTDVPIKDIDQLASHIFSQHTNMFVYAKMQSKRFVLGLRLLLLLQIYYATIIGISLSLFYRPS